MSTLVKLEVLKTILEAANLYRGNLLNKNLLFVYQKQQNQYSNIETVFEPRHFQHFTGTKMIGLKSTVQFFEKCIDNDLGLVDFDIVEDGTTRLKMNVICDLMKIHTVAKMIGDYKGGNIKLVTDKLVGNTRGCMGFIQEEGHRYWVPNTLLEYDMRELIQENQRLMAVYYKGIKEERYNHMSYLAKGIPVDKVRWTKEIEQKIVNKENLIIDFKRIEVVQAIN